MKARPRKAVKKAKTKRTGRATKRAGRPAPAGPEQVKLSSPEISMRHYLHSEIWPMERDVLFRPDRYKYVRKLIEPEGCVFCAAQEKGVSFDSLVIAKTQYSMVVLNKFPYNPGHILILPVRHCGDLLALEPGEYHDLHQTLRRAFAAVDKAFEPAGVNLGMNHGHVAGAGIPDHLHYHLVPRWKGDLNFFPLIAETKAIPMSLEQAYDKLLEAFK